MELYGIVIVKCYETFKSKNLFDINRDIMNKCVSLEIEDGHHFNPEATLLNPTQLRKRDSKTQQKQE